jgi:hypothetical protein
LAIPGKKTNTQRQNGLNPLLWEFGAGTGYIPFNPDTPNIYRPSNSATKVTAGTLAYFGTLDYDYKDKYLASFSARRDGSYAFGANNKFGNFFAGSLGWIVSDEDFFKVNFIDYLKLRGSFGITGNENVNPQFQRISTLTYAYGSGQNAGYTFGNDPTSIGATIASFKNEDLGWEKQDIKRLCIY